MGEVRINDEVYSGLNEEEVLNIVQTNTPTNTGVTMTLLWENPSPSASFGAKTVTLNQSAANFDFYSWTALYGTSSAPATSSLNSSGLIPIGATSAIYWYTNTPRRRHLQVKGTSGVFTECVKCGDGDTKANSNNVPYQIWGYKM